MQQKCQLESRNCRTRKEQQIYDRTKNFLIQSGNLDVEQKMKVIDQVLKKPEGEERYSFLYDLICDYLDSEFRNKNICGFTDNLCKRRCDMVTHKMRKDTYRNGCCYSYLEGKDCEHLNSLHECRIKNIACKAYTCYFLRKKGYRYTLNRIYLSRYFFNWRQKFYIEHTYFVDKPVVMQGILKRM